MKGERGARDLNSEQFQVGFTKALFLLFETREYP